MDENNVWFTELLTELAKIMGVDLDITSPNDVCEFLMPEKDREDKTKICLYDLINYLGSEDRSLISMAVAIDMPYLAEKNNLNNKYKALARLELDLLDCKNEEIRFYVRHSEYEMNETSHYSFDQPRAYSSPVPTTLLGLDISDYLTDPENPVVAYVIELFKDKRINNLEFLGSDISPWSIMGANPNNPRLD